MLGPQPAGRQAHGARHCRAIDQPDACAACHALLPKPGYGSGY